jgi:hypothetical protein
MAQARGYKGQVVLDFETAFGVDPASVNGRGMPINSWDVKASRNLNTAQTITGTRNPVQPFQGNVSVTGQAVVPLDLIAFGWWLRGMFGAPATTGSGPYTHVFKIPDTQPSMVAEKKFDFATAQSYVKQNGIKISSLGLNFGGDGELVANLGIVGAKEAAPSATPYDATVTAVSLNRVNNFQAAILEGGASIATVTDLAMNLEFGLDTGNYVIGGGGQLGDIPEGIIGVSGTLTALYADNTLQAKAAAVAESSLAITLTSGAHSLKFEIPELFYQWNTPGITGPQGVRQELPFQGFLDNAAGASAFIVTLVNAVESYA